MGDLATVALLALLPPAGNLAGAVLAEVLPVTDRWLNRALHTAAGVVVAVVAFEIFPPALDVAAPWILSSAFLAGGMLYVGAQALIGKVTSEEDGRAEGRMWMIYLAVSTDLFADGLLLGAGASVSTSLGIALAAGQVLADMPEGFASIFTFRANGVPRRRRLLLSVSFFVPTFVAAGLAVAVLRDAGEVVQYAALVVAAGLFTVAAFEDMVKEAHASKEDSVLSPLALIGGFTLFGLVSGALG